MLTRTFSMALVLFLPWSDSQAREKEAYCKWGNGMSESRLDTADDALLSERRPTHSTAIKAALNQHLPFGLPQDQSGDTQGQHKLVQADFVVWYDNDLRVPLWTAHHLSQDQAVAGRTRVDSFRSDPRIKGSWQRSECADYKEPIFDQGHMVPRADMNHSEIAMDQTFLMSNMTPQHCAFNRGIWQILEKLGRNWASEVTDTWIVAGTIFDRNGDTQKDADQVAWRMKGKRGMRAAIPSHQYKILVRQDGIGWETLTLVLPNNDTLVSKSEAVDYLNDHIKTLAGVEQLTGLSFLAGVTVTERNTLWPISGEVPSPLTSNCHASYPAF